MIKSILTLKQKLYLVYFFSKNEHLYKEYKNKKKIFVCLGADYGNLGDVAITFSQINFLKNTFPNYEVIEFPISQTFKHMKSLEEIVNNDDIITIVGGGNTTEKYKDIEYCRQFIINKFRNNKIITFPQSVELDDASEKFLKDMRKSYLKHKNIYYLVREKYSYETIRKFFPKMNVSLFPDIVFSYHHNLSPKKRKLITVSMRKDKEKYLSTSQEEKIITFLKKNNELTFKDTQILNENDFSTENRKRLLNDLLNTYLESKIVITDRLHGMILSYITNTPCIVLPCNNLKIKGCYEWIKNSSNVYYLEEFSIKKFIEIFDQLTNKCDIINDQVNFMEFKKFLLAIADKN